MKYHPPQRPQVADWDYQLFHHCVEAGYCYHDAMLGTLLELAGNDTAVVLMSDHGFHPDDMRLNEVPREPAGPAAEHRQFGTLAVRGPGIRRDARIYGANLLDVCPTLLHLFGLPMGEDMDGKVLVDLYEKAPGAVAKIASWDEVDGDHGMHPPDRQISADDSKAALEQLVALGYIAEPDVDQSKTLEQTVRELDYNLAQAYIDGGIYTEAVALLERLYATWPMEHRFGFKLATCYSAQNRPEDLRRLVTVVIARRLEEGETALAELKTLQPEDEMVAKAEQERIDALPDGEKQKFYAARRELSAKARPNLFSLRYLEATADYAEKNYAAALEKLDQLDTDFGARRNALTLRGDVLQRLQRWGEARAAFVEALEIDKEAPGPLLGLARTSLAEKNFPAAIDHARASLGLLYFQPLAHYICGLAQYRLGEWQDAEQSFGVCVHQAPLFTAAFRMLGQIARYQQKDAVAFSHYQLRLQHARQQLADLRDYKLAEVEKLQHSSLRSGDSPPARPMPELEMRPQALAGVPPQEIITVVSGLPRSGTSLMIQMLDAAGFAAFSDGQRQADDSNQKGYYEHEKVGTLLTGQDRSWVSEARGKALKVVAPLLAALPLQVMKNEQAQRPERLSYRVIFLERPMAEILSSQDTMLKRLGRPTHPSADISKAYNQQVRNAKTWIVGQGITALSVSYAELVHAPESLLPQIAAFLGCPEKVEAMQAVIDPELHRARE